MSARKVEFSGLPELEHSRPIQTTLTLPTSAIRIGKNGIEFCTYRPLAPWTEMTVQLQLLPDSKVVHCTGVIVSCRGNALSGYDIAMVFTNISPQSEAYLTSLSALQKA